MARVPDLWHEARRERREGAEPLPERVRPRSLDEVIGQSHLLGEGRILRRLAASGRIGSLILHGPPGTGKTTLGRLLADAVGAHLEAAHAALIGVARIREVIEQATRRLEEGGRGTILFLDEIHRFSKAQQDSLLADVERGTLSLVGATTENPSFAVNGALVSRSVVAELRPLGEPELREAIARAIRHPRGFPDLDVRLAEDAATLLARRSDGDARRALGALEVAVRSTPPRTASGGGRPVVEVDLAAVESSLQAKHLRHDRDGDAHYDLLSAFIKSMRGSDPDAAIHWLARLLAGGEDPRIVARRIAILASEDIGNADPQALSVAAAAWAVTERVGMPECQLTLAQAAIYMCQAPKSNATAQAIWTAMAEVREGRTLEVPQAIRDRTGRDSLDRAAERVPAREGGEAYANPHSAADGVGTADYLPSDRRYYEPSDRGFEVEVARRLNDRREAVARRNHGGGEA